LYVTQTQHHGII